MMDLRILTLLVVVFGVVYSHTTPHNDEYNFIKLFGMMTKLQNQQQELKVKVMDSMDKQNEKLSNFEAKVIDSMDKQNEKLSNFEVKVDSLVKKNENFEGKIQNLQETLTEQHDQNKFHLQIEGGTINNYYYGCDNSTTMPPTEPPTTTVPPTEPPTTTMPPTQPPVTTAQDCTELYSNGFTSEGVYAVYPDGGESIDVYCQDGWTLLQKRTDDSVNYTKTMEEYERGFGSVRGEHWIGLNAMNKLTKQGSYTVRFEFEDFDGSTAWAEYTNFHVDAAPSYTLMFDEDSYDGTAGDSLGYHHGKKFSTMDVDQDERSDKNCSTDYFGGGGWWFGSCSYTSTTGMPYATTGMFSIMWYDWKHSWDALKSATIKIKRV